MKLINEDEFIKNIVKYKYFSTKTIGEALGNTKEFKGFGSCDSKKVIPTAI